MRRLGLVLAALLAVSVLGYLYSAGPTKPEFPPHSLSYSRGKLMVISKSSFLPFEVGQEIEVIQQVEIGPFKRLKLKKGYVLRWMIFEIVGGDANGVTVAIREDGEGFSVEPLNWTQASFLFAPIRGPKEAEEYVRFLMHDTMVSIRARSYKEITSQEEFDRVLSEMKEHCAASGDELKVLRLPPVNQNLTPIVFNTSLASCKARSLACKLNG